MPFHSTLIFRFIWFVSTQLCSSRAYLFHRFSATQNKSDDRIIKENFASRIYSFPFHFYKRSFKNNSEFQLIYLQCLLSSKPFRVNNLRSWGEMKVIASMKRERLG